jgi:hypothetical protein
MSAASASRHGLVGLVCLAAMSMFGCSSSASLKSMSTATGNGDVASLRSRPLVLPKIAHGQPCPLTTEVATPSADLGPMLGSGPARPLLGAKAHLGIAPAVNFGSDAWGGDKVFWALSAQNVGPALVRGHQLDGDAEVRFDDGALPSLDKVLDPTGMTPLAGGWYGFPGYTRVRQPGCYGFQIDTDAGATVVVFEAV